jgi:hypothetical protein
MASLSGNKIKDTFDKLLKLESAQLSASEQVVEDGAGNNSALKLSTDTLETTGELKISGTPSTSTSITKALMLSTSGVVVTRDLNTNPIGTASITANTPLSATGSTVELQDAGNLGQITSPANADKYLIWDETASAYKYIEQVDLVNSVSTQVVGQGLETLYARPQSSNAVPTVLNAVQFAEIFGDSSATGSVTAATSSVIFGSANTYMSIPETGISDPRDNILINEKQGFFQLTASIEVTSTANTDVTFDIYDYSASLKLAETFRTVKNGETYHLEFNVLWYSDGLAGYKIQLRGFAGSSGVVYSADNSHLEVRFLGTNTSF